MTQPIGAETLCGGCRYGKIMVARNILEEDEDGEIIYSSTNIVRSMCSHPLFVGDGCAQNMGVVTMCEAFKARKEYSERKKPVRKIGAKKAKK